jgi:hypothetical protein
MQEITETQTRFAMKTPARLWRHSRASGATPLLHGGLRYQLLGAVQRARARKDWQALAAFIEQMKAFDLLLHQLCVEIAGIVQGRCYEAIAKALGLEIERPPEGGPVSV